jgi:FKBP-type peptidyl-prolyl cis-trans isomerase SlyD
VAERPKSSRLDGEMITEVNEEAGFVVVDTNHPLAGMTREFDVTVVAVRDAPATAGCGKA